MPVAEDRPNYCPNGHPFGPGRVLIGWAPAPIGRPGEGARSYTCLQCQAVTRWTPTLHVMPHKHSRPR